MSSFIRSSGQLASETELTITRRQSASVIPAVETSDENQTEDDEDVDDDDDDDDDDSPSLVNFNSAIETATTKPIPTSNSNFKTQPKMKTKMKTKTARGNTNTNSSTGFRFRFGYLTANINSIMRDQLANERSFLAYVRATMTLLVCGLTIVQLHLKIMIEYTIDSNGLESKLQLLQNKFLMFEKFVHPLALIMCSVGIYCLFVGLIRYFINLNHLYNCNNFVSGKVEYFGLFGVFFAVC
ncbi:unnamed protein product [Ambrosiozyma monospora]|uniref:Unnamed protein product n=1 Tax=Ambrosiozyma monospora TaxID=43982 RepID=A0A9W6YUU6_AMBMO|nr:unnamed protein product [Ambrosiozyma monospora]